MIPKPPNMDCGLVHNLITGPLSYPRHETMDVTDRNQLRDIMCTNQMRA